MLITPEIRKAVEAYQNGASALEIQKTMGVRNQIIYRALSYLGLPTKYAKRIGPSWCAWCGNDIRGARKFCCNKCYKDFLKDTAKRLHVVKTCKTCEKPLPTKWRTYCSSKCQHEFKFKKYAYLIANIKVLLGQGIPQYEIAAKFGVSRTFIRKIRERAQSSTITHQSHNYTRAGASEALLNNDAALKKEVA